MSETKRFLLTDFDILPDTGQDAVPALQRALAACAGIPGATLVIPPGHYDLYPEQATRLHYGMSNTEPINPRTIALPIRGFSVFTIEAEGASFVYHGRMMPIVIEDSQSVRIHGLTIDAAVPSVCQGRIDAAGDDWVDITIEEGADIRLEDGKLVRYGEGWHRPIWGHQLVEADGAVVYNTGDGPFGDLQAESLGEQRFRLRKPAHREVRVGMYLILRSGWRDHSAIFIYRSQGVILDGVTIHFANGTGILGQRSEQVTMTDCRVVPAPGRAYSTFADATHWSGMRGALVIRNCEFAGHLDDAANVHGTATVVQERLTSRSLLGRFAHWESVDLLWAEAGDEISFFPQRTLQPMATAKVAAFTPRDAETFELVFESDLPDEIDAGFAMENLTWTPDFVFHGNRVSRHRARGILVSTAGTVFIEGNTFASPGAAIVIAGDANYWYESGPVRDVLIRGNRFDHCNTSPYGSGAGIIHIDPVIPELHEDAPCYHANIRIEGNDFQVFDTPFLAALSVDGLTFCDNTITVTDRYPARVASPYGLTFDACRNVTVAGNQFVGGVLGRQVELRRMPQSEAQITGWEINETA